MVGVTVFRGASDAEEPAASQLADDVPPGLHIAESSAGVGDASDSKRHTKGIRFTILVAGLQDARTATTRLESLQQLAAELQPPEDLPMDLLDNSGACKIALAMREVDPEKLDAAAAAVPLIIAMLHCELYCNNKEQSDLILGACLPHVLAVTAWTRTVSLKTHLGLPSRSHLTALRTIARLCNIVADFLSLSKEQRRASKPFNAVKRLPLPETLAFEAACLAARASLAARQLLNTELPLVLGAAHFSELLDAAVAAALTSLHALRRARQAAGHLPCRAAAPTADTICNLLPIVPHGVDMAMLQELSDIASLLTAVTESITYEQAAQLEAGVVAAATFTLTTLGLSEAAEANQSGAPGGGVAQLELTSEGLQQQQLVAQASAPELQHLMPLSVAISHVVATTQMLAAVDRGLLPCRERTDLLARLLRWAVDMQRIHRDLLVQQPQHSFQASHWHNGASRNELLSDQVLNVADAAAHGIAAAVLVVISASIRRRCQAVAAARSSCGGQVLPPCTPDAQLAAVLPAIDTLIEAQAKCSWGNEPPNGAWQSAHALVTLAGHLADVLADADRTAAAGSAAAAGSSAAAAAQPAAAAGTAADAYPACGDRPSTEAEDCAARRGYTAAVGQPVLDELVGNAVTGAVVVASWAANVLKQVQRDIAGVSVYSNRLEKAAAELRPARLAVSAAGVLGDLAKCEGGRSALLEQRQSVLQFILPPLEAALTLKGMHQGAAATAELTALVHGAAGLLRLLLTPDAPPAAATQRSIDSWHRVAAEARKRPQGAFPRDLLQAAAAVSNALQGACGKPGGDGAAAAGQLDARAAADAVAAALLQDEIDAAAAAPGQPMRQHKGKKGRGGKKK